MASSDEYQQQQFWKDSPWRCIEQDEKGNCLMSAKWILLDLSESSKSGPWLKQQEEEFLKTLHEPCITVQQLKLNKNDS